MTDYNEIIDDRIVPGKPVATSLQADFRDNPIAIAEQAADAPTTPFTRILQVREQRATGLASQALSGGAPYIMKRRDLSIKQDSLGPNGESLASLQSGTFANDGVKVPAGQYVIEASSNIQGGTTIQWHKLAIYNVTAGQYELYGINGLDINIAGVTGHQWDRGHVRGVIALSAESVLEIHHIADGSVSGGNATSLGPFEVYADIIMFRTHLVAPTP